MAAVLASVAVATVVGSASSSSAASVPRLQAYGIALGGTRMLAFWTDTPQQNDWVKVISGLDSGTFVVGIDIRVQDGKVYAVGSNGAIYVVAIPSAVATKVSQLTETLYGTKFGVDFNPAADRLRVVSDNGQNLRHNLADHTTIEDAFLTTPPNPARTKGVTASAYTNNDLDGTTNTTLFGINTITDEIVIQSPANLGFLVPTGKLGVDAGLDAGFDIYSDLTNGKTKSVQAFATLNVPAGGFDQVFYSINLLTGEATTIGTFPLDVTDVAIMLDTN